MYSNGNSIDSVYDFNCLRCTVGEYQSNIVLYFFGGIHHGIYHMIVICKIMNVEWYLVELADAVDRHQSMAVYTEYTKLQLI